MKKWTVFLGIAALGGLAEAQYSPFWFDGFDVTAATANINAELGFPRQGGPLAPTTYVTNTANPANDYHHQMFAGTNPLQLAGDGGLSPVLVSPNVSFTGVAGNGNIIGKRIELVMDAFTNNGGGTYFAQAAITFASNTPLAAAGAAGSGFSVVFVEDTFGGAGNVIQLWDGSTLVANNIPNPQGAGSAFVEILIDDLSDGNPWDGVGSTSISVIVQGNLVGTYEKTAGGYTANYITLEGSAQLFGMQLATHTFDNLGVNSAPVPEPATYAALLGALVLGAVVIRRRTRR